MAIECGFITTPGLYRVPGSDTEVKKLKEDFSSKYAPKLDQISPETLTGYIKKFLRDLRNTLLPESSYKEILSELEQQGQNYQLLEQNIKKLIQELPIPNRDTLAFLCAHWQRVALHSKENQMNYENLAKVLGPTVVGSGSAAPKFTSSNRNEIVNDCFRENERQIQVLNLLLHIPNDFWTNFYDNPQFVQSCTTPLSSMKRETRTIRNKII